MAKPEPTIKKNKEVVLEPVPFTGIARSVECVMQHNHFTNLVVVALHIENGIVIKKEISDPYASFEIWEQFESRARPATLSRSARWCEGKAWDN